MADQKTQTDALREQIYAARSKFRVVVAASGLTEVLQQLEVWIGQVDARLHILEQGKPASVSERVRLAHLEEEHRSLEERFTRHQLEYTHLLERVRGLYPPEEAPPL